MTLLVGLVLLVGAVIGFFIAWHWQRVKYEKVLKILGNKIHATNSSMPS